MALLLIISFSLTACSQGLAAYKENAKQQIESYANAKGRNNFSEENWAAICKVVEDGKKVIEDVKTKPQVDTAVTTAKAAIDAVKEDEKMLKHPNSDERIDTQLEITLRQDFAKRFPEGSDITAKDIWVRVYYGTFGASVAVIMNWVQPPQPGGGVTEIIAGFEFGFLYGPHTFIYVWNDGKFYTLLKAYEDKLLAIDDIETIWQQHNNNEEGDMKYGQKVYKNSGHC